MKAARVFAASFLALALTLAPGCGESRPGPHLAPAPPVAGNPQTFWLNITNGTQWDLNLGWVTTAGGASGYLIIPVGDTVAIDIGFLPGQVSVTASTTATPSYTYPTQTQSLYTNYGPYDTQINFNFP